MISFFGNIIIFSKAIFATKKKNSQYLDKLDEKSFEMESFYLILELSNIDAIEWRDFFGSYTILHDKIKQSRVVLIL